MFHSRTIEERDPRKRRGEKNEMKMTDELDATCLRHNDTDTNETGQTTEEITQALSSYPDLPEVKIYKKNNQT